MPSVCCAIGCSHVTGNGVCHLKRFPNDKKRAIVWAENTRGSKWQRKGWELLCDCHFESSQFEKIREDGGKKLRRNAIPTIFPTHTLQLDHIVTGLMENSSTLECQYVPYDLDPLADDVKLPDTGRLLFPEALDLFNEGVEEHAKFFLEECRQLNILPDDL